ncbi:MAG: hypothetical protein IJD13_07360 [Oscillospiraceae bacterium]|nr:hypothetical protein [Oscillospiraceae bacterium]
MIMIDLYLYLYLYLYFYLYLYGYACFYFYLSTPINNLYLKRRVVKFWGNQAIPAPEEKKSYREKHVIPFYPYRKRRNPPVEKEKISEKRGFAQNKAWWFIYCDGRFRWKTLCKISQPASP